MNSREIADRLYLSPNTVRSHVLALYRILGAANRSDAVEAARKHGLLP
jgi:DNA-binding CsgD family transcriptional regulator